MPLILLSGYPCAGKTYRANQIRQYFETRLGQNASADTSLNGDSGTPTPGSNAAPSSKGTMTVVLISDHTLRIPRSAYATAAAEKTARATLSAAVQRALTPAAVVVVDAPSYIKGWRYQMFCEAKAQRTAHCVVHVGTPIAQCRATNESRLASATSDTGPEASASSSFETAPYNPSVFDNLIQRYEEPNGMARWDSPLFTVPFVDPDPPCAAIWDALIGTDGKGRVARPNAATVLPTARPADALSALERISQSVSAQVAAWLRDHPGEGGGQVCVDGSDAPLVLPMNGVALPQLQRLRRQFVALYRAQAGGLQPDRMAAAFVTFLNDTWETAG